MAQIKVNVAYGATGTLATANIADDAITAAKLADDSVVAAAIADNAVVTAAISADAITAAKVADDIINSEHIAAGGIDTEHIADDQITLAKMAGGTDGNLIGFDASGNPAAIATGTAGQVLTSGGANVASAMADAPSGKLVQVKRAVITYGGGGDTSTYAGLATNTITNPGGTEIKITGFSATSGNLLVCWWQYGGGGSPNVGLNHSFGVDFGGNGVELAYSGYWGTNYQPNNIGCMCSHLLTGDISSAEIKAVIQTEEDKVYTLYGDYTVSGSAQGHIVCMDMEV